MKKFLAFTLMFVAALFCFAGCSMTTEHFLALQHKVIPPFMCIGVAAIDSTRARAAYAQLISIASAIMAKFQGRAQQVIVSRSYLLTEQVIQNNLSTYNFDTWNKTLQNQSPKRPLVQGVNDNDLFLGIASRLLIDTRAVDTTAQPATSQSNVTVETWPDPLLFQPSGCTVNDLWAFFNARWSLTVDRVIYVNNEFTRKFLKVPQFLQYAWNAATQAIVQPLVLPPYQLDGAKTYYELDPYPIFSGRLDNKLTLNLSLYTGFNAASNPIYTTLQNVVSFEFDGYTIQNGAGFIPFFNGSLDINNDADVSSFSLAANL